MNLQDNNWRQIVEALTCPLNRAMTMREHSCNEMDLFNHPEWLIKHYIENGGAVAFAKKRSPQPEPEYMI